LRFELPVQKNTLKKSIFLYSSAGKFSGEVYCHRHETFIFHRHLLRPSASLDLANSPEFTAISATLLFPKDDASLGAPFFPKDDASLGAPLGHKI
jgi:hypothetical protein